MNFSDFYEGYLTVWPSTNLKSNVIIVSWSQWPKKLINDLKITLKWPWMISKKLLPGKTKYGIWFSDLKNPRMIFSDFI